MSDSNSQSETLLASTINLSNAIVRNLNEPPCIRSREECIRDWQEAGFGRPGMPTDDDIYEMQQRDQKRYDDWMKYNKKWKHFIDSHTDAEKDLMFVLTVMMFLGAKEENNNERI